eukprot:1842325-Rhodomonas_salina.3
MHRQHTKTNTDVKKNTDTNTDTDTNTTSNTTTNATEEASWTRGGGRERGTHSFWCEETRPKRRQRSEHVCARGPAPSLPPPRPVLELYARYHVSAASARSEVAEFTVALSAAPVGGAWCVLFP